MTLKTQMEALKKLQSKFSLVSYSNEAVCLADIVYAISAVSHNLTANEIIEICDDVLKEYVPKTAEEE